MSDTGPPAGEMGLNLKNVTPSPDAAKPEQLPRQANADLPNLPLDSLNSGAVLQPNAEKPTPNETQVQIMGIESDLKALSDKEDGHLKYLGERSKPVNYLQYEFDKSLPSVEEVRKEFHKSVSQKIDALKTKLHSDQPSGLPDPELIIEELDGLFDEIRDSRETIREDIRYLESPIMNLRGHSFNARLEILSFETQMLDNLYLRKILIERAIRQSEGVKLDKYHATAAIVYDYPYERKPYTLKGEDGEETAVYAGGSPKLIAVYDNEHASAYQEAQSIARAALEPYLELGNIQDEQGNVVFPIKCILLAGSTVAETKTPSDLDIVVIFEKDMNRRHLGELIDKHVRDKASEGV